MTWKHDEMRAKRHYTCGDERKAYSAGYSDGFHGYPKGSGVDPGWYLNAYSAGYWDGHGDNPATQEQSDLATLQEEADDNGWGA